MNEIENVVTGSSSEDLLPETKHWYVVYTKPDCEMKVARLLAKRKIEHYCPKVKVGMQLQNKKKVSEKPLFRSYVFVYIPESSQRVIKKVEGIKNLVYWLNNPVIVSKEEIENIRTFLNFNTHLWHYDYAVKSNTGVQQLNEFQYFGNKRILAIQGNVVELEVPSLKCVLVSQNNVLRVHPVNKWKTKHKVQNFSISNDVVFDEGKKV